MFEYTLQVNKGPYREGDHLAILIYKSVDETCNGAHYNQQIEEHFERLMWGEENKSGGFVNLIDIKETQQEIYFLINCEFPSEITAIAKNIVQNYPDNYNEQYTRFISLLSEQNIIINQL